MKIFSFIKSVFKSNIFRNWIISKIMFFTPLVAHAQGTLWGNNSLGYGGIPISINIGPFGFTMNNNGYYFTPLSMYSNPLSNNGYGYTYFTQPQPYYYQTIQTVCFDAYGRTYYCTKQVRVYY